jgi:hypothetical protein
VTRREKALDRVKALKERRDLTDKGRGYVEAILEWSACLSAEQLNVAAAWVESGRVR